LVAAEKKPANERTNNTAAKPRIIPEISLNIELSFTRNKKNTKNTDS